MANDQSLCDVVKTGSMDAIKKALNNSQEDINQKDAKGNTLLHIATTRTNNTHSGLINLLLDNGADTRIENNSGEKAVDIAPEDSNIKTALIRAGSRHLSNLSDDDLEMSVASKHDIKTETENSPSPSPKARSCSSLIECVQRLVDFIGNSIKQCIERQK